MLILSNSLSEVVDEGCLNVANSLVKRIKKQHKNAFIVTYDRKSKMSDLHLKLNKLLINSKLFSVLKQHNGDVLYIPFPAKEWATAVRVFILSLFCKKNLYVALVMKCCVGFIGRLLFKASGARFISFSEETRDIYSNIVGSDRVDCLKVGVDTTRFVPVLLEKKKELRAKYNIDLNKKVILHVGHLKEGRNVGQLLKLNPDYQIILVVSTLTEGERDTTLKDELSKRPNIIIIDEFMPNIEEIYQLSDVYFFPTVAQGNCIDAPLSCFEAAACNLPVVTTDYGAMKEFKSKNGFYFIDSFDSDSLNVTVLEAINRASVNTRELVLDYDWSNAVSYMMNLE